MTTVVVPPLVGQAAATWAFVVQLAAAARVPRWVLVGGLMVQLHALEHTVTDVRPTRDIDVLVDLLVDGGASREMSSVLEAMGLVFQGINAEGVGHRFKGQGVVVDVLVPDHLSARADTVTVPPARTVQVPGGRRALHAAQPVQVRYGDRSAQVLRPGLCAAIVGKVQAFEIDVASSARERHLEDVAMLVSLVQDPVDMAEGLHKKERAALRKARALLPDEHPAWRSLGTRASEAVLALELLSA